MIECGVCLLDVLVERIARLVRRQDLGNHDRDHRKLPAEIVDACLHPSGRRLDPRLRGEEHVVVANHQHDALRLQPVHPTVIQTPQHILRLIPTDADIDGAVPSQVLFPGIVKRLAIKRAAPLLSDTVADQQDVDGTLATRNVLGQLCMSVEPCGPGPVSRRGNDRPHRRQMLHCFGTRATLVLWRQYVG